MEANPNATHLIKNLGEQISKTSVARHGNFVVTVATESEVDFLVKDIDSKGFCTPRFSAEGIECWVAKVIRLENLGGFEFPKSIYFRSFSETKRDLLKAEIGKAPGVMRRQFVDIDTLHFKDQVVKNAMEKFGLTFDQGDSQNYHESSHSPPMVITSFTKTADRQPETAKAQQSLLNFCRDNNIVVGEPETSEIEVKPRSKNQTIPWGITTWLAFPNL